MPAQTEAKNKKPDSDPYDSVTIPVRKGSRRKSYDSTAARVRDGTEFASQFVRIVRYVCLALMAIVAVLNMPPYRIAAAYLIDVGSRFQGSYYVVDFFLGLSASILGLILWVLCQSCELLPAVVERNNEALLKTVQRYDSHKTPEIKADDDWEVAKFKRIIAAAPTAWVKNMYILQGIGYAADAVLLCWAFPPLLVSWGVFLAAPDLTSDVDWVAVTKILVTMFAFEKLVELFWFFGDLAIHHFGEIEDAK